MQPSDTVPSDAPRWLGHPDTASERVAVVGAGIVGLAHAWAAARRGHAVSVFDRDLRARGASVRNFGMVWPIGQPAGDRLDLALESRGRWLALADESGIPVQRCGSIHLAHAADELAVLEEFITRERHRACRILSVDEVRARTPAANPAGLLGGLWSGTELGVDPRATLRALPSWLADRHGVRFTSGVPVVAVHDREVAGPCGVLGRFDRVVVCPGADLATLVADHAHESADQRGDATRHTRRCKLQMLKLRSPAGWRLGPHLAGGLTLRHYASFAGCPGLPALRDRIATRTPELDRLGIHVMASQSGDGAVIVGDSHEYDASIEPFDREEIDSLILRELRRILALPDWTVLERWHGVYLCPPTDPPDLVAIERVLEPGVHLCTGTGGAGMTLAFGIAERSWTAWSGPA